MWYTLNRIKAKYKKLNYMKIKPQRTRFNKAIIAIGIVVFVVACALIYIYAFNGSILGWNANTRTAENSTNLDKPTKEQKEAGDQAKKDTINDSVKPNTNNSDQPLAPTSQDGNNKNNVDVIFTSVSQNGELLQLRSLISVVESSGSCTLTLTSGSQTITKTSATQAQSNSSTCMGFDIPVNELNTGSWLARLNYSGAFSAGSATKNIEIN